MSSRQTGFLALIFAAICWGLAPVATRELVAHLTPLHLLLLRFSIASIIFCPVLLQLRAWTPRDRLKMIGCGLVAIFGYYIPVTIGGKYLPAGVTGLLVTTETLWMVVLAVAFLRERMTASIAVGLVVSTLGSVLLLGGGATGQSLSADLLLGGFLTLFAALMWAVYSLAVRPLAAKYGALPCTGLTAIIGVAPLLLSINSDLGAELSSATVGAISALIVLAVFSTVIGNFFWSVGLVRVSGVQAGIFLYLVPLISVVGGVAFLHEGVGIQTLISGFLIAGGVLIAQMAQPSRVEATT